MIIFLAHHKELKDNIYIDDFDGYIKHRQISFLSQKNNNVWSDSDTIALKNFINNYAFDLPAKTIDEAIDCTAFKNHYHPVKEYFNALKWDQIPRVETWLHHYLGVNDTKYSRKIGIKTLAAAVARIFQPGITFDNILIIEGGQGVGKSRAIKALASPEWFTDDLGDIRSKDAIASLQGVLIAEISELDSFKKADISALKAFLSRTIDKKRLPYEKRPRLFPRQGIFIGTTNDNSYLYDDTGGRRFWPVTSRGTVKVDAIKNDRDQLWAEAILYYRLGEDLWLKDPRILAEAKRQQELRRFSDEWENSITEYIEEGQLKHITSKEIWTQVFANSMSDFSKKDQGRIAMCMKALNYKATAYYDSDKKKSVRGYVKHNG